MNQRERKPTKSQKERVFRAAMRLYSRTPEWYRSGLMAGNEALGAFYRACAAARAPVRRKRRA